VAIPGPAAAVMCRGRRFLGGWFLGGTRRRSRRAPPVGLSGATNRTNRPPGWVDLGSWPALNPTRCPAWARRERGW